MKKKLSEAADIKFLVDSFYQKVVVDDTIGYFFNEVVKLDWDRHMPVMYQFWETVLFGKGGYKGNPVLKHVELNQKAPMTEQHFERWILLWESTIDEHFEGEIAEEAKKKAITMKLLMLYKIGQNGNPNFVQ